jgi:2-keto-4-pentenoate hydratase
MATMPLQNSAVEQAAKRILADYDAGRANQLFAERGDDWLTMQDAYALQKAVARLRDARGERRVGYKVGCVSTAIQKQFGLSEPVRGYLWESETIASGSRISDGPSSREGRRFVHLAVEGEIAIRMGRDVSPAMRGDEWLAAADAWFPVIELHNYVFRSAIPTSQELIAGNAMHAGFVIAAGSGRSLKELRDDLAIEVTIDGHWVEARRTGEIPGGPLGSLRWLASSLARSGETLKAGEIVLTGSPGKMIAVSAPARIVVACAGERVELTVD